MTTCSFQHGLEKNFMALLNVPSGHYTFSCKFQLVRFCSRWLFPFNVVVPSESKLTVATCNWTRALKQVQTTQDGVNGGTLPCVWLVHATSGDSVTNNLTYLPSITSWMTDSTCWIGQEYRLASDVQRRWKNNELGGSRCGDLTATDACKAMHHPKPRKPVKSWFGEKSSTTLAILGATDSNVDLGVLI